MLQSHSIVEKLHFLRLYCCHNKSGFRFPYNMFALFVRRFSEQVKMKSVFRWDLFVFAFLLSCTEQVGAHIINYIYQAIL